MVNNADFAGLKVRRLSRQHLQGGCCDAVARKVSFRNRVKIARMAEKRFKAALPNLR
jgi:hypothetical protein